MICKVQHIANAGYAKERANRMLAKGDADLVAFGTLLRQSDLPARFAKDAPLNEPDPGTFYGGSAKGYTDYPFLEAETA